MSIDLQRLKTDFTAIARCTATPGHGATRPTFSPAWAEARAYVIAQLESAGCTVRIDAAGNVHARLNSVGWNTPAYLCGSHIDSVPNGGDYDGVAGVVVALELLRSAREDGVELPLELIIFAEEEGPTFGLGMLGSRAWVGDLTAEKLATLRNSDGQNYLEAGKPFGVDASKLASERFDATHYLGLIEVHIEQGPAMWAEEVPLAVVTAIAGRSQYRATITGTPNHAGSTPMQYRRDALLAAAKVVVAVNELALQSGSPTVATVGRLECEPNAVNVIPGVVRFTIDVRSPSAEVLADFDVRIRQRMIGCADGLAFDLTRTEEQPPVVMDRALADRFLSTGLPATISGALHDSAILAPHLPTVMLFVPSRDGISHNPDEFSRVEDVADAGRLVEKVIRRLTIAQLNAMSRDAFVKMLGGIFEHSPWVAELAWEQRPFKSVAELHAKMVEIVARSEDAAKLALIKAHPDLVGHLAREGKLTRESTAEQAAAGLDVLSLDEVAAFERYNGAYRERFGFPFIICARQNKKGAILAAMPQRLTHARDVEIAAALSEIGKITALRLADAIWES